jgi:two-component sensor histidine kinase
MMAYAASDASAFNMLFDSAGYIWFDNYLNKICRLDTASGIITVLTEADGYEEQAYGSGSSAAKDARGNLYFGDAGYNDFTIGLDRIYPERYSSAAGVYLRSLDINQKPFSLSTGLNNLEELSLNYDQNSINFETGIIDYYARGKGHIRYKLEENGKDVNWQYGPAYYTIRYEGLQPGKYKLTLQASNVGNEFNSPIKILFINISPAFWNTWWFRTIVAVFILGVFYLVVRYRTQQKFKLQLERTGKEKQIAELGQKTAELQQQKVEIEMQALRAQMNPHFIFNSLNSINRFILQNDRAQASEYLTKFSKLVRMILQNSQASLITLESELESLDLYLNLESLRFNYHFDYNITVPKDLDKEVLQVPPLILQPYVENAIWHGLMHKEEKGHLDIDISEKDDQLFLKIRDDGVGREKAKTMASKSATKHKSMGLRITENRIAILQKNGLKESPVTIHDLVNHDGTAAGTEVVIKMPLIYD